MFNRLMIAAAAVVLTTLLAVAGPWIPPACVSERAAGNGQLCGCIQQVADMTLSRVRIRAPRGEILRRCRAGARGAHVKSDTDNAFWARYKNFATTAEAYCAN